ncbi:hypothetical protein JCM10908_002149 [Rhodotorula pacifica]|uniref:uncharacterized protein n=1 Tax=Rhodotorula pacifica TaxID=1495444 RepID=UPI00317B1FA1
MGRPRRHRAAGHSSAPLQTGDVREPIGPPSALLPDASAFADRVEAALDHAKAELDRIKQEWAKATPEQEAKLKERCSVQALRDENKQLLENQLIQPDIREWVDNRWFTTSRHTRASQEDEEERDEIGAAGDGILDEPARKKKRKAPEEAPDFGQVIEMVGEEELQAALEEAEKSKLNLLKPPQVELYLRKTRTADTNCLLSMRAAERNESSPPFPPPASKAARMLYTITVHPAPHGLHTQHVPQQKLVCLGTTTLAEIRDNLLVGGDNIPVEVTAENGQNGDRSSTADGGDEEEDDEEEKEGGDEDGFDYSTQQQKPDDEFFGGGLAAPVHQHETRWKNERRLTGAVFVAEGVVYADKREGMQDYASFILNGIEKTAWPGQPPAVDGTAYPTLEELTPLPDGTNGSNTADPAPAPLHPHRGKPNLCRGTLAHETTLSEMPLRVGQPYSFVHQGDVEHIWSVDEIRALHPADPSPWPPETAHRRSDAYMHFRNPYPITTFLSRFSTHTLSNSRCRLCEREAVDLALLDDALTGETPAHVCRTCFGTLHPVKRDWEEEARPKKKARGRPRKVATPPPLGYEDVENDEREHMVGVRTVPILYER